MRSRFSFASFALSALFAASFAPQVLAQQAPIWFDDIKAPLDVLDADGEALMQFAVARLRDPNGAVNAKLPVYLAGDAQPRAVILSFTGGEKAAEVRVGSGRGVVEAIEQAARSGRNVSPEQSKWVKLDIVRAVRNTQSRWTGDTLGISTGEGVALTRPSRVAISWEQLSATGLVTDKMRFDPHLLKEAANDPDGVRPVHFFTCDSFYTDGTAVRRVRNDNWMEPGSATQADYDLAITLAGDYMKRSVGKDGKFVYQHNPTGIEPPRPPGGPAPEDEYNIVRHCGAILALVYTDESRDGQDPAVREATVQSIKYLLTLAKPAKDLKDADGIVDADEIKLGSVGLGLNAIARYTKFTGDKQFLPAAKRLGNWLVQTQGPRGNFTIYTQRYSDGVILQRSAMYATGEAIWGLCALHEVDPTGPWLDSAARVLEYMITTRDRIIDDDMKYIDHWMLYSIENVNARGHRDDIHAPHARKMIARLMSTQVGKSIENPDWVGAYTRPPNANQTATRIEGLTAAYRFFATRRDSRLELDEIRRSIESASRFQFRQQFLVPQAMYYATPQEALGGFRNSPTDPRVRIDTVQHGLVALIGARDILFPKR